MFSVRHVHPARSLVPRLRSCAVGLVLAACGASPPSLAGQASASFAISIQFMPEWAGTCTASATTGAPQVTCRPTVVGGASGTGLGGGGERQGGPTLLGSRAPDTHLKAAKLAGGELVEVGAENSHAWTDDNPYAQGEYSSRLVMAGGVSYVEMTVSW